MQVRPPSFVTIDGRKMAYDEVSPSRPKGTILLLTGLGSKRLGWMRQMDDFGREYRTIVLDHRDTGDSDEVEAPYTIADLADDAAALLTKLGIVRAHVAGISLGGYVALEFAVRHPEQLDKLVLVSTSAGGRARVPASPEIAVLLAPAPALEIGARAIRNYSRIMAAQYVQEHPEELERVAEVARYRPMSAAGYGRQLQATLAHDVVDALHQISTPTLVIHGESDPLVPPANGAYLVQNIPGARYITYPGVGHVPIVECAEQFNRDVLAFLSEPAGSESNGGAGSRVQASQRAQP
jgi:pimeloyl-ACP methyl ester carboxylesterase